MSILRNIEFIIQEALVGMRRNGLMAVASISTTALSLAILASFCLFILGAHRMAQRELRKFEVAVFLKVGLDKKVVSDLAVQVGKIPAVQSVKIYPKEKAWQDFKKGSPGLGTAGLKNPLPDTLRVTVRNPRDTAKVSDEIRKLPNIDLVQDGRTFWKGILAIADFIKWFGAIASFALLCATILIISNAIRLTVFVRRREIKIMQLVGATNWFIRAPLVIEGIIFGAGGAAIAFVMVGAGMTYINQVAVSAMPIMQSVSSGVGKEQICWALVSGGAAIGAMGSMFSIHKFLKI
ncbi:MAG: permease-like cell division protein FtsX [Armatimonadota bacterium]|nr:permease-like cell division protein FtsX [Armatimonadota bacterium]